MHEPELLSTIRRILLALVLLGIGGLVPELLLLGHTESATQIIPLVVLGLGVVSAVVLWMRPTHRSMRIFQAIMVLFVIAGVLGVYFHVRGNVEFEREQDPSAHGLDLLWRSLSGGVPTLAPGAMVQLGLLGLVFAFRHPVLRAGAVPTTRKEKT